MTGGTVRPGPHLTIFRKSRQRRTCEDCGGPIAPGDLYSRISLPPGADVNAGGHWWTLVVHAVYPCETVR